MLEFIKLENVADLLKYQEIISELLPQSTKQTITESFEFLTQQGSMFLGISQNNQPVGFVQYLVCTNLENNKFLRLDEIIVNSKFQSQGIGTKVMKYIETIAQKSDCKVLSLGTNIRNGPAQKFYFKNGFLIGAFGMYKIMN